MSRTYSLIAAVLSIAAAPAMANPLAPVTNIVAGVPVAGPVVVNVISALPLASLPTLPALPGLGGLGGLPALPMLPGLQGTVAAVVEGKGVIVGINTANTVPVSITPVGLPTLPALPGLPN